MVKIKTSKTVRKSDDVDPDMRIRANEIGT
jgi:hypothetical protein